ncbi:MAG TPA: DUF1552 domain-containing protein [Terriglobia bacterium]|nr:DUF1552 domain-containing protein [Terriglobia bacterium]
MNFITKKHLSRRTFLRGAGVTLGLPLLESMAPAQSAPAAPKTRLAFIFYPHGVTMDKWVPAAAGSGFEFTPILKSLEPHRDYINVISNTYAPTAYGADASAAANHSRSSAVFLSAVKPDEGARQTLGETADQVAARAIGQETPLPSIELTVEPGGLTSPFRNTISWRTPTSPLPMEHNPQVIFEKLFGDGSNEAERAARRQQARSLLDSVMEQVNALKTQLPAGDRGRLAGYLDDVREIERRIHKSEDQMKAARLEVPDTPAGVPATFEEHIKLLFDLQILAFRADITRISTLMLAHELSNATFPATNIRDGFHNLSHHSNVRSNMDRFAELNAYHHGLFAAFVDKLKTTSDGAGNLLDHSLVLFGSGMSDSNQHNHTPLPMILAGRASGGVKGGRHIRLQQVTTHANLLLTMLHKAGVRAETFGDSTGTISEL